MAVDIDLLTFDHNLDRQRRVVLRITENTKVLIKTVEYIMDEYEWEALKMRVDAKFSEE